MILRAIATVVFVLLAQSSPAASAPTKVTIHIPSKSLSIMPYYFGKDKGFFAAEQIEPQPILLAQPEIKSIEELIGKTVGVTALTDAVGMSTNVILRAHGIEAGKVTLLAI